MKINFISNIAFKNVIRFNTETNLASGYNYRIYKTLDSSTGQVINVLNSIPSKSYTKYQSKQIRDFFARNIPDYDGISEIQARKHNKAFYLISGDDVKKLLEIENNIKDEILTSKTPEKLSNIKRMYKKVLDFLNSRVNKNEGFYFGIKNNDTSLNNKTNNNKNDILKLNNFYYYNDDDNKKVFIGDLLEL